MRALNERLKSPYLRNRRDLLLWQVEYNAMQISSIRKVLRAGFGKRCGWKYHPRGALTGLGEFPNEGLGYSYRGDQ